MDLSKYDFDTRKALHFGLRYAKGLGHSHLECEHVALAVLRSQWQLLDQISHGLVEKAMEQFLEGYPKKFGSIAVEFGPRLSRALDQLEASYSSSPISYKQLWKGLAKQSSALQKALLHAKSQSDKRDEFEVSAFENFSPINHKSEKNSPNTAKATSKENEQSNPDGLPELDKSLREFTIDVTALALTQKLEPVYGRDTEVRRVIEILGRKKKSNPILIGEPGVGKTAVVEGLARRLVSDEVPESMRGVRVLSLELGDMVAGSRYRGDFESKLKRLVESLQALEGKVILFIDEIHSLIGAGAAEGSLDAAQMLKPALARGAIKCIGATTLEEYRRYFAKDQALERRFQPLLIEEPGRDHSLIIMRGIKDKYEVYHKINIEDEALVAAVDLSMRFLPTRMLPDKAIDVIDEACSRVKIESETLPRDLEVIKSAISNLEIQKQSIEPHKKGSDKTLVKLKVQLEKLDAEWKKLESAWLRHRSLQDQISKLTKNMHDNEELGVEAKRNADFALIAKLDKEQNPQLQKNLQNLQNQLSDLEVSYPFLSSAVTVHNVSQVVAEWSGIPINHLENHKPTKKSASLYERLNKQVFGQRAATSSIDLAIRRAQAGINDEARPHCVLFFSGPTGVGKTAAAKALARELFADEKKIIRIDMSEYMEQHSVARLIGAPPGYVGHQSGGELTNAVRQRPYSVVLFDEIEKAHPKVLDICLQIFDEGRLTDSEGRLADFRHTIIILTSNIPLYEEVELNKFERQERLRRQTCEFLRPELVNRIDEVVLFKNLGPHHYRQLIAKELAKLNQRLSVYNLRLQISDALIEKMTDACIGSSFGGRGLVRYFREQILDPVADRILHNEQWDGFWEVDLDQDDEVIFARIEAAEKFLPPAR